MTKEQLQERIEKKNKDIEKINKRIAKWSNGLRPEDIAVVEPFGNCIYGTKSSYQSWCDYHGTEEYQNAYKAYKEYVDTHKDIPSSDDWNKGPNMRESYSAYRDLGEARHTLAKYQVELEKLNNYENEEKVEVIWNFLMNWKELARKYYHSECDRYYNLKKGYKEAHKRFLEEYDDKPSYTAECNWERDYFYNIDKLTKEITKIKCECFYPNPENRWEYEYLPVSYTINEELLEETLNKEVRAKYSALIQEITHITGEIIDARGLSIGAKGDINGIVIGKNGKARVNTFEAGIYYIVQRPHYRTKITEVK